MDKSIDITVVRVDKTEFELSNGQVFQHPIPLDNDPDLVEFNKNYQYWRETINHFVEGDDEGSSINQ